MAPSSNLFGIVDLGTWTIRFSINSVNPAHARILPCVFQDKAPIHLYKGPGVPISADEIKETILCLARFKSICRDYGVPKANVRIAANPNEAPNFDELVAAIHRELCGLEVLRLSRDGEHWANAHGIASAFHVARGLYIELRPDAANLYYLCFPSGSSDAAERVDGPLRVPYLQTQAPGSADTGSADTGSAGTGSTDSGATDSGATDAASAPAAPESSNAYLYGPDDTEPPVQSFSAKLKSACQELLQRAAAHESLAPSTTVYLSGSGFFGLHSVLATLDSETVFPATTGLSITREKMAQLKPDSRLALLLKATAAGLPECTQRILYARHNLRHGLLFQALPAEIKRQDPLLVATRPYALPGAVKLAAELKKVLPESIAPAIIRDRIAPALANAAYIHSSYGNEIQPKSALVVAHTGLLAGTHGLTHEDRALLGLALCERWGGQLDHRMSIVRESFVAALNNRRLGWWARYLGLVLHLLGAAFPGAHVRANAIAIRASEEPRNGLTLKICFNEASIYSSNIIIRQRFDRVLKLLRQLGSDFGSDAVPLEVVHGSRVWD